MCFVDRWNGYGVNNKINVKKYIVSQVSTAKSSTEYQHPIWTFGCGHQQCGLWENIINGPFGREIRHQETKLEL